LLDTWTGRAIERIPVSDRMLTRARAFARADHPALQGILRLDHDEPALWLEARRGRPLDRSLTPAERRLLQEALDALHAAGAVHGLVDAAHLVVDESGVVLRFAGEPDSTATVDRDRLALSRL
jgi:serine/threonine-protein kinase